MSTTVSTKHAAPGTSWRTLRLRGLAAITVGTTAVISFSSVQHLADMAGFSWLSWLFPVCLDAVAAFSLDVYMRRSHAQWSALCLAMTAISMSLAANVADHYLSTHLVLSALLGAIPPFMLAALMMVLHQHGRAPKPQVAPAFVPLAAPVEPDGWREFVPQSTTPLLPRPQHQPPAAPPVTPVVPPQVKPSTTVEDHPVRDAERTVVMRAIRDEQPGKLTPDDDRPEPAKALPARTVKAAVSAPANPASDEVLAKQARADGHLTRRAIQTAYHLGTKRAGAIARLVKEA